MADNKLIKKMMLAVIALLILLIAGFVYFKDTLIQKQLPKPVAIDTSNQPMLGNPDAKLHIVAFEDLKCSNCARYSKELFPKIKKQYIDTGIANYTMINLAFVPGSSPAANAARCIYIQNHDLFFNFVEMIFQNQPPEDQNWATVPNLLTYAAKIKGIDTDKLMPCLIKNTYAPFIENNLKIASAVMNPVSTPAVYVNGVQVTPLTEKRIHTVIEALK